MGGRNSSRDRGGDRRDQSPKKVRGFARGHGAHHRHKAGSGAPHRVASGKDRTQEGARRLDLSRLDDAALADLNKTHKNSEFGHRLEEVGEAGQFGSAMKGEKVRGIVVEVRKGNFLTRLVGSDSPATPERAWKPGDVIRTIARGMMQQFDTGLSSLVAPGDDVELIIPPSTGQQELFQFGVHGVVTRTFPRRSEFRRLHPSGRSIQTLAANADRIFIVSSTAEPEFRPGFVDRVLVCAAACGIPTALIVNKIDMGIPERDRALIDVYRALNIPVFETSAKDAELGAQGLQAIRALMAGQRNVLTGHSGVGKSSLLLRLDSSLDVDVIRTGEVSTQTGKGTHTTTHARLFEVDLGGGARAEIIDTPGVREFTPADTDRRNLWGWFPEIARLQGQCTFSDCTHTSEKGCAVLAAVERGEIHARRHRSYVRIYETLPN